MKNANTLTVERCLAAAVVMTAESFHVERSGGNVTRMHCTFYNVIRLFYVLNVCFENEFVLSRSISLRFLKEVSYNHSMKSIFVYFILFVSEYFLGSVVMLCLMVYIKKGCLSN